MRDKIEETRITREREIDREMERRRDREEG